MGYESYGIGAFTWRENSNKEIIDEIGDDTIDLCDVDIK